MKPLRVARITLKDYKSIRLVDIQPDGSITTVTGEPGQGKTSIITGLEDGLFGGDASRVRRGADQSEIFVDLDLFQIHRTIKADGSNSAVLTQGPEVVKKLRDIQARVNALVGPGAFRPIRWVLLSSGDGDGRKERLRQQKDQLLKAIPITIDRSALAEAVKGCGPDAIKILGEMPKEFIPDLKTQHALVVCDALYGWAYGARKMVNDEVKSSESSIMAMPSTTAPEPTESLHDLQLASQAAYEEWQQAIGAYQAQGSMRARELELIGFIDGEKDSLEAVVPRNESELQARVEDLDRQMAALAKQRDAASSELMHAKSTNRAIQDRRETLGRSERELAELRTKLKESGRDPESAKADFELATFGAKTKNIILERRDAEGKLNRLKARAGTLNAMVKMFKDLPSQLIAKTKLPIEGLGIDGDQITIKGIPIQELGTSEQIRLGVKVFMAINPGVKFICIDGAESLGQVGRDEIRKLAEEHGLQFIMAEVTTESRPGEIRMQNGEVQPDIPV